MGYCEKNIKQKNKKEKACTKIMKMFHDAYDERKRALENFEEEEENIASAQREARDNQEMDFDDYSNDDEDEAEVVSSILSEFCDRGEQEEWTEELWLSSS